MKICTFLSGFMVILFSTLYAQSGSTSVYPQSADYWTGTTDSLNKTDSCEIRGWDNEDGWMMFDVTSIPANSAINSITLWAYVSAANWPYWSATPLPYNGVTASAAEIYAAIQAGQGQDSAYLYLDGGSTYTTGWYSWLLGGNANNDLQAALSQGWFSIGVASRDNSPYYGITFGGWCSPNVEFLNVNFSPLPVELTSFTAGYNDGKVILNWKTATEKNNKGFEIQKSVRKDSYGEVRGRSVRTPTERSVWEAIGYIEGNGTTSKPQNYTFTDDDISASGYAYRLKQIDFDGSYEYSEIVDVSISSPVRFSLEQNYPNPFNPETKIKYSIPQNTFVTLRVYNILGREVASLVNEQKSAGYYEVDFNAQNFASGIYLYKLNAGTFSQIKKMIMIK